MKTPDVSRLTVTPIDVFPLHAPWPGMTRTWACQDGSKQYYEPRCRACLDVAVGFLETHADYAITGQMSDDPYCTIEVPMMLSEFVTLAFRASPALPGEPKT